MDKIIAAVNWVVDNWVTIVAVVGGVFTVLNIVVRLTPTKKDDEYLAKAQPIWTKIVHIVEQIMIATNKKKTVK